MLHYIFNEQYLLLIIYDMGTVPKYYEIMIHIHNTVKKLNVRIQNTIVICL